MSSPPLSFAFPTTDPPGSSHAIPPQPSPQRRQHLLSFRRISLPTPPSLVNRKSTASLASYDSFPEENGSGESTLAYPPVSVITKNAIAHRKMIHRPFSLDPNKRVRKRRDSTKPPDESKAARRRKIIAEFYDTERVYVQGLDLIYSHFLTPIIESLDTPSPLLDREDLVTVFSNFIDIWNLHRSFFTSLTGLLSSTLAHPTASPPPLSPVLISHFPYLSLYTPFITTFPSVLSRLTSLSAENPAFAAFLKEHEADERCGKLKLRDWLLTIVQRCPRYLLLLKDLINCTEPEDQEHTNLTAAHTLLSKVTTSLDTSLHTHAQTLSLLALQRATPDLPMQLISPGRSLLRRGALMQLDHTSSLKEREFLLFTDCLLWLASSKASENEWLRLNEGMGLFRGVAASKRPEFKRSRSKSENELPDIGHALRRPVIGHSKKVNVQAGEDRWFFKGKADLIDIDIVIGSTREIGDERRLEILSPEISFAVYTDTEQDRDDWASAIRSAKASLLVSLNVMHPNSTLASSSSKHHLRRSLQALPYLPAIEEAQNLPRRGKVDHFVPAIWVPDGKTDSCMRCGKLFGWRRRRHHCRLCGRCICAACSERTFFISDSNLKNPSKSARACNACYDTVFPLLESSGSEGSMPQAPSGSTLSSFPSWKTQKSCPPEAAKPSELMALDAPLRRSTSPDKRVNVIRKRNSRPLSHPVIPQVFQDSKIDVSTSGAVDSNGDVAMKLDDQKNTSEEVEQQVEIEELTPESATSLGSVEGTSVSLTFNEDESPIRRKRFSMPAMALQTTSVTTRPDVTGEGRRKRFSLVLGGKHRVSTHLHALDFQAQSASSGDLRHGVAAARLTELLEKMKPVDR